jgi:hypothetical protein
MTPPRFEVFADSNLVGYSELEWGDPPMGVAGGRLFPLSAYEVIQPLVVAARDTSQAHLALSVQTPDGRTIQAQGGTFRFAGHSPAKAIFSIPVECCTNRSRPRRVGRSSLWVGP